MQNELKAACAVVTLLGVWGTAEAQTTEATFAVVNEKPLDYATGLYQYNPSGDPTNDAKRLTTPFTYGSLATATAANPHEFTIPSEVFANPLNTRHPYTFLGVYDEANGLVSVLLKASVANEAIAQKLDWEDLFSDEADFTISEGDMAKELKRIHEVFTPYSYNLRRFVDTYESLFPAWGEQGILVNFSTATYGGTGFATPPQSVPEPASMVALGAGALALLRRRRKA